MTVPTDATAVHLGGFTAGSISRFTHDIKDQNNSILLGADLLHKYWENLNLHLAEARCDDDPLSQEAYREILNTIQLVISGIRKASEQIDKAILSQFP